MQWQTDKYWNINTGTVYLIIPLLTSYPPFFLTSVPVDQLQSQTHHQTLSSEFTEAGGTRSHQPSVGLPMGLPRGLTLAASSDLSTLARVPGGLVSDNFLDLSTLFVDPHVSSAFHKSVAPYNKSPVLLYSYWFCFCDWTLTDMRGSSNKVERSHKVGEVIK